ncbi:MAG: hypothetical protein ACRC56_07305 [Bosea sp. (in: a-proteobacteria)]
MFEVLLVAFTGMAIIGFALHKLGQRPSADTAVRAAHKNQPYRVVAQATFDRYKGPVFGKRGRSG